VGEIVIKIPSDFKKEVEVTSPEVERRILELVRKLRNYEYVVRNFDRIVSSVEINENALRESEMYGG